jgi:hypothetical protein
MQNLFGVTIMNVYHGTNIKFDTPKILNPNRALDFGAGFYTTTDEEQAISWAKMVVNRSQKGVPLLNVYEFDADFSTKLQTIRFENPTKEWLDFVCEHRLNIDLKDDCDLIIGPVANDRTMRVINNYMQSPRKDLYYQIAIDDIKAANLSDQYVMKNNKALALLKHIKIIAL